MTDPSPPTHRDPLPDTPHPSGSWKPLLPVAVLCYLPFLLTRPGLVSADTKSYLYLDPGRLLGRAWSMWDPSVGMGTVSHQTVGYLWPMGPWFWAFEQAGAPDWIAQRLWWGSLLFAAIAGAAYLLRRFELPAVAIWPAAIAFGLSPYAVAYLGRLSGVLMPAIGLPWLLAFTIQAVRTRGWRYPALFALVAATVGSVNLTALVLAGIAPVLWLAYVLIVREASLRRVATVVAQIGLLTTATSAWWLAGLSIQATHGIDIVRYSESAEVVARTSVSFEVLRGLGYWFFYGGDKLQLWIEPSFQYTQRPWIIAVTFAIPIGALLAAGYGRWRHRTYFAVLFVVGSLVAMGAHPWFEPTPLGALTKAFLGTERGLAFRSLPRAVPVIALASAALLAGALARLAVRSPKAVRVGAVAIVAASIVGMVPLWQRSIVQDSLSRGDVPAYWTEAGRVLDERDDGTRVLEVPGSDFASYRWGNTVDPITPGLMDRPYVARELVPYGTPPSADLLNDLDLLLQERTLDPEAIAPVARLMRVGDIVVRGDLQYERYALARPRLVWDLLSGAPGLGEPIPLTEPTRNEPIPQLQLQDETWLLRELALPDAPAVAIVPVEGARPIVDVKDAQGALVLSGDGAGIVDVAAAGLLDPDALVRYSASLDDEAIAEELDRGASLIVTDSNRQRGERWGSLRHTRGYTEEAGEVPLAENLTDNRLPRFPEAGDDARTLTSQEGGISAHATSYGNPITFAADGRAALAVDGDLDTAWATAAFSDARGERIELDLDEPLSIDHLVLHQLSEDRTRRAITKVSIDLGDGEPLEVELGDESRLAEGQRVELGAARTVEHVEIEVLADNLGSPVRYEDAGPVGFAEIELGDDPPLLREVIVVPTDLVDGAGEASADAPLAYVLTRLRQDPTDRTRDDEERSLVRRFRVPTDRSFVLEGTARLSARADDPVLDRVLGTVTSDGYADSSRRVSGSRVERASAAVDGDLDTAWTSPFARVAGETLVVRSTEERTYDRLDLEVVADGIHSVPTRLEIRVDGEVVATPDLPAIVDGAEPGATTTVPLDLPPTRGRTLEVEIADIRPVRSVDWTSGAPMEHPVAIAELGLEGFEVPAAPAEVDDRCRDDLLTLDGEPLPVRLLGSSADALAGEPLTVEPCSDVAIDLAAGDHELASAPGVDTGFDLDQVVLASDGEAATADPAPAVIEVTDDDPDHVRAVLRDLEPGRPVWLVLGQSWSDGWTASVDGESLGTPELVDGFANGWLVEPEGDEVVVELTFTPQQRVDVGIALSLLAAAACLVLVVRRPRPVDGTGSGDLPFALLGRADGRPVSVRWAAITGLAIALVAAAVVEPLVAIALGAAGAFGVADARARRGVELLPAALLSVAVVWVLALVVRYDIRAGIEWVSELDRVHPIGLAAVVALAVDVVVDHVWRRNARQT
jgi:arabinofuranan 3-O-arabinosyltransferase